MENKPTCRKCNETEEGVRGFLLECCRCGSWIHPGLWISFTVYESCRVESDKEILHRPGCHKPNVSVAALRAMILVSDRTQGAPGSLEAWSCRDCSSESSVSQKTQESIDLTLDSDSDDGIQVVEQPQPQRVKREDREVVQEIKESSAAAVASTSRPAFELYAPPPYLDTLIKSRESTAKAYLKSLFPPNHTRSDYNALFDTNANQVDNPFIQWLRPEPVRIVPIPSAQRHRRKPLAKHAPSSSPSTSQLQETSWTSWGDS